MKDNPISPLNKEQFHVAMRLYPYVFWADLLRIQFETAFTHDRQTLLLQTEENIFETELLESEMYICLWFGVLYTAIEGWPTLKIKESQIEELLGSPFKNLLRNFRNATSDSDEFDGNRIQALVTTGWEPIDWARKVTLEYKSFFESILGSPRGEIRNDNLGFQS
ncbi:MAG TPA: hypothetical protein VNA23_00785 [Anaerolineales bacterium]|nr:hypothetical protein [Anaerolineales bacterium]